MTEDHSNMYSNHLDQPSSQASQVFKSTVSIVATQLKRRCDIFAGADAGLDAESLSPEDKQRVSQGLEQRQPL